MLYFLKMLISLFVIVNPIGAVPVFLAITKNDDDPARMRAARGAGITTFAVLATAVIAGDFIFRMFDVSVNSFQIAGGIILFAIAFEMLHVRATRIKSTEEELAEATDREHVGVTPLGMPLLAGPGAITTTLVFRGQTSGDPRLIGVLLLAVAVIGLSSWAILAGSARIRNHFSPIFLGILTRVEGLILATIAVQMAVNGVQGVVGSFMQ